MRFRISRITWPALALMCSLLLAATWSFGQELDLSAPGDAGAMPSLIATEDAPSLDGPALDTPALDTAPMERSPAATGDKDAKSEPPVTEPPKDAPPEKKPTADKAKAKTKPPKSAEAAKSPERPPLSEEMTALRDKVRQVMVRCYQVPIDTGANTAWDVLEFCLPFGVDAQVRAGDQQINALGCLCWNYSCGGYHLLWADEKAVMPRVGYGFQGYPSQLLAVLAQASVPADYELHIDPRRATVADLVKYEQQTCHSGLPQAHKLIALAYYAMDDQPWKNDLNEQWSVDRLFNEELNRAVASNSSETTDRLMGLSYALGRRGRAKKPIDGEYARAEAFLDSFSDYALRAQNSDGSWHPSFFAFRGTSRDFVGHIYSTGNILQWLVFWLPDDKLTDAEVVRSVDYLAGALDAQLSRWNVRATSPREISAVAHAANALVIYNRRVFSPYDEEKPAAVPAKETARSQSAPAR